MIRIRLSIWLFAVTTSLTFPVISQTDLVHTKSFAKKLEKFGLEYFEPVENWLHPVPYKGDKFAKYDMVFISEDDSLEVRYIFQDLDSPITVSNAPHVEFMRMLSTLATNDQNEEIIVQTIPEEELMYKYRAYWGYTADFVPKNAITRKNKARALVLFNPYKGLIFSLLFYNNLYPPAFFELPIRFRE